MSEQQLKRFRFMIGPLLAASLAASLMHAEVANADIFVPDGYRVTVADKKFDDTRQFALVYEAIAPRGIGASHLELAVGAIGSSNDSRALLSVGPVWQLPLRTDRFALQVGFSPTLISGSTFDGRDMGGNLHFTSSASFVANFGATHNISVALRIQHISNGGLSSNNPGMDMFGLTISYRFNQ